jgi:hypothetical protein
MTERIVKQSTTFDMRLEPRVKKALEQIADFYGLSQSGWLRMMILREVKQIDTQKA